MLQDKLLKWVITFFLSKLDKDAAAGALCAFLRGAVDALALVAAKTETPLDDEIVTKLDEIVEQLAKVLGH